MSSAKPYCHYWILKNMSHEALTHLIFSKIYETWSSHLFTDAKTLKCLYCWIETISLVLYVVFMKEINATYFVGLYVSGHLANLLDIKLAYHLLLVNIIQLKRNIVFKLYQWIILSIAISSKCLFPKVLSSVCA